MARKSMVAINSNPGYLMLDPNGIHIGWRARTDLGALDDLADSIQAIGQLHPIVVMPFEESGYSLIAGFRRLKACQKLGRPVKAHVIAPESATSELVVQFDENMKRKDFDSLEQSLWLARFKTIYEELHPETKLGAAGRGRSKKSLVERQGEQSPPAPRFTLVAAERLGFSERKVQELLDLTSLPTKHKKKIEACQNSHERERTIQECLKEVRQERKLKKLEKIAEEKKAQQPEEEQKEQFVHLYCGDNKDYWKGAEIYDLIITDPPYDRERSLIAHISRASIGKNIDWDKLDLGWVTHAAPMLTKGGQMLIFCPLESVGAYELALQAAGLVYRGCLIWHRSNSGTVYRSSYLSSCEAIIWATNGGSYIFHPWEEQAGGIAHNFIEGPICGGNERLRHETQKPEWLLERLIKRHTVKTSRVFDPFAGVASTLAVCKRLGIYCVGVEIDEEYYKIGKVRLSAISAE